MKKLLLVSLIALCSVTACKKSEVFPVSANDTLRVDTLRVDTLRVDTLKVDTLKVDTLKVDTLKENTSL